MNEIKCVFVQQGLMMGKVVKQTDEYITFENPVLVITQPKNVALAPVLQMVEEDAINIYTKDMSFKGVFTPKIDFINSYQQMFGSGIVVPQGPGLTLTTS